MTNTAHLRPRDARSGFFYGWILLGIGFLCMTVAYGVRNSFGVFYLAILDEFGWGRAETAIIFSAAIVAYGLVAPLSGGLIDRFGPRRVMPLGCLMVGGGAAACSYATEIWQFVLLFGVVATGGCCLTGFVANAAVLSRWFVRKRGLVFGILNVGFGTSFVFNIVAEQLIARTGWRTSYVIIGATIVVILLPLLLAFARHDPSDMGLLPDGDTEVVRKGPAALDDVAAEGDPRWRSTTWTIAKAVRTYQFWAVLFANLALWGIGENLLIAHQVAFSGELGLDAVAASGIPLLFGLTIAVGALGGPVADRLGREWAFTAGCALSIIGLAVLIASSLTGLSWLVYVYAVLIGVGLGICGPSLNGAQADLFAGRNFGSINGTFVMGMGMGGLVGPWLGGFLFDVFGSYRTAFVVVLVSVALACLLLWVAAPRKLAPVAGARR